MSIFLSLDMVWLDGTPMTSAGEVNMAAALTREPAIDAKGEAYHLTHTWPSIMILARPDLSRTERIDQARYLVSEMGMMRAPRRSRTKVNDDDAKAALLARWSQG